MDSESRRVRGSANGSGGCSGRGSGIANLVREEFFFVSIFKLFENEIQH